MVVIINGNKIIMMMVMQWRHIVLYLRILCKGLHQGDFEKKKMLIRRRGCGENYVDP